MGLAAHGVVVVAGWDPSGGGGLIRDLQTLRDLHVRASGVIAALTTQDVSGRGAVEPVSSGVMLRQLNAAAPRRGGFVLKIGMVYSRANIEMLAGWIERRHPIAVVLDPVMESKGGLKLATRDAVTAYPRLIRYATVLTPNLVEARTLLAPDHRRMQLGPKILALLLHRMGAAHVLLKLPATGQSRCRGRQEAEFPLGDPPQAARPVSRPSKIDLHFDGDRYVEYENRRPHAYEVRGSGCTLASAIAAFIARGLRPNRAIPQALRFVRGRFSETVVVNGVRLFA